MNTKKSLDIKFLVNVVLRDFVENLVYSFLQRINLFKRTIIIWDMQNCRV